MTLKSLFTRDTRAKCCQVALRWLYGQLGSFAQVYLQRTQPASDWSYSPNGVSFNPNKEPTSIYVKSQPLPFSYTTFWNFACLKHTSWPAGRVCSLHRTELLPLLLLPLTFVLCIGSSCFVYFPSDLNGFWFKIYKHWLTVTLLMRCNFCFCISKSV